MASGRFQGTSDTTYAEQVALDGYYVRNWSVWLDLIVLARNSRVVVSGSGRTEFIYGWSRFLSILVSVECSVASPDFIE